jgi:hypothetical protein
MVLGKESPGAIIRKQNFMPEIKDKVVVIMGASSESIEPLASPQAALWREGAPKVFASEPRNRRDDCGQARGTRRTLRTSCARVMPARCFLTASSKCGMRNAEWGMGKSQTGLAKLARYLRPSRRSRIGIHRLPCLPAPS